MDSCLRDIAHAADAGRNESIPDVQVVYPSDCLRFAIDIMARHQKNNKNTVVGPFELTRDATPTSRVSVKQRPGQLKRASLVAFGDCDRPPSSGLQH